MPSPEWLSKIACDELALEAVEVGVHVAERGGAVGVARHVRLGGLAEQLLGLVAHLLDDAAQARIEAVAVDPPGRLAQVDGEVGRALDLGDDPQRGDDLAEVAGDGRLQGEHRVAALLELDALGVDLVVAEDHVLGALEVLAEQDLRGPRDVLGDLAPRAWRSRRGSRRARGGSSERRSPSSPAS